MGTDQARSKFDALYQKILKRFETTTPPAQVPGMSGREEGRRDTANEQGQGRASQQLVSLMPGQRAVSSLIFLVYGVYLVKAEVQEDHAREVHPDREDGLPGMREGMMILEMWCRKPKSYKNCQGEDPRALLEKQ